MFTGLVLGMGEIVRSMPGSGESRFTVRALFDTMPWVKGESIAVNGVCLSVERFDSRSFDVYASCETVSLTTLKSLTPGTKVNLERALALGDRLGGHMVSGHVDGIAELTAVREAGSSKVLSVSFPEQFSPQVIPKGSMALDGVSLTINQCVQGHLEVNVIPETQATTTIGSWRPGQLLNFETDLIGKYVQRMLEARREAPPNSGLTLDFLRENGF